jgi:NarL family two-component system response regulator LiaR
MAKQDEIRVLIVDDHDMLREGLTTFLMVYSDLNLVGEATNGAEAIQKCQELEPDVVLMDLMLPDVSGVSVIEVVRRDNPCIQFIALSSFDENKMVQSALDAGAISYLLKNISADRLAEAIRSANAGFATLSPEVTKSLTSQSLKRTPDRSYDFTRREQEVLGLMADGLTNAEIGLQLNISKYTVKNYISSIFGKLDVNSRTEAVCLALKQGLVRHSP